MPTLMAVPSDLKHLFDTFSKCRTRAIRLYRIFVRSNARAIEQRYYRTVIRHREAAMSAVGAIEVAEFDEVGDQPAAPLRLVTAPADGVRRPDSAGLAGVSRRAPAAPGVAGSAASAPAEAAPRVAGHAASAPAEPGPALRERR